MPDGSATPGIESPSVHITLSDATELPVKLMAEPANPLIEVDLPLAAHSSSDVIDPEKPTDKKDDSSTTSNSTKTSKAFIEERQLGVYEMLIEVQSWKESIPGWKSFDAIKGFYDDRDFIKRFVVECVTLAPSQFALWLAITLLGSFIPAVSLYLSGQLMGVIQVFIESGAQDATIEQFYYSVGALFAFRILENRLSIYKEYVHKNMKNVISTHFNDYLLRVNLRLDLPTWHDPIVKAKLQQIAPEYSVDPAWKTVSDGVSVISSIFAILSELYVLMAMISGEQSGLMFAGLAAIHPMIDIFSWRSAWPRAFYVYIKDAAFARIPKIMSLATDDSYRQHIIGDGLQDYIHQDYKASKAALEGKNTASYWDQMYTNRSNRLVAIFSSVSQDLPLVLFALQAIRNNKRLPLKSLTLLSQSATSIGWRVDSVIDELKKVADFNRTIRTLYEAIDIVNQIEDGGIPYPPPDASSEGMKIEFRDVTFKYPQKDAAVLRSLSFTIQPGQLCVIVGENGCGKSSTVKLINRLFDTTEGTVLVDDVPVREYKADQLRSAQAILYQDFVRYPTNIRDNIGFGLVSEVNNMERIKKAAELGGALSFIEKLPNGFDSEISSKHAVWSIMTEATKDGPLQKRIKDLEESVDVSGGQWQRLAVSRSFMRAGDEKVRLMCYDEPSSALDPKAEFELFEKLRLHRGNRTLVFITHRFGHLTKYADVILYMKDGRIEEHGTHAELLAQNGSYAHLYNVQAQAFS